MTVTLTVSELLQVQALASRYDSLEKNSSEGGLFSV